MIPAPIKRVPQAWLWLGLIIFVGAWLRFYRINTLPPALSGDEILVTLLARDAVAHQDFPIYFPAGYGGFHPVIVYMTMLARWLTGNHFLAIRFGVAALGVVSIPIVFLALHAIFRLDDTPSERSLAEALMGTGVFAIMFPNILINRLGFEVMFPALAGALAFLGLAQALRTGRRRYYVLSGLALGASLYTYYSARLLPVAITAAWLWVMRLSPRAERRQLLRGFAQIVATSFIVFAPLGLFFLQNPQMFFARAATTSSQTFSQGPAALPGIILSNTLYTLAGLSLPGFGDLITRHNIAGHPVFDAFLSLLFWLGVTVMLTQLRTRRAAMLSAWSASMLAPVIVAFSRSPHFTRMHGVLPALAGICGLGGVALFELIRVRRARLAPVVLAAGLVFSLGASLYDYFVRWANDPLLFDAFQIGNWQAGLIARERVGTGFVYLTPELLDDYSRPTFNLMLDGHSRARAFPGPDCLVYLDQPDRPLTYVVDLLLDHGTMDNLYRTFPTGRRSELILQQPPPAWPLFAVFDVPAGASAIAPPHTASVTLGDTIRLTGYSITPPEIRPGDTLTVTLYWQAIQQPREHYIAFAHLHASGQAEPAAQHDSPPCNDTYGTTRWAPGETIVDKHILTVPADFGTRVATVAVGMYAWTTLERLPLSGADSPDQRFHLPDIPVIH